jgi:polar amino acid transport system substrate-binding protein
MIRITNGEWKPFYSENLKYYGLDSHIVTEAFASEGIRVIYGFFPWKRSYEQSKKGKWDGTVGWPYGKERENFHYYSKQPVNEGNWVFFHLKDSAFDWDNMNDVKKARIGITLGDWVMDGDDEFTKALREGKLKYDRAPRDELNFLKLNAGRIDVFPQQLDVGYEQIRMLISEKKLTEDEASRITHHPEPFRKMPLYLLLSKKIARNRQMIDLFDKGFARLKESGKYDRFVDESRRGEYKK